MSSVFSEHESAHAPGQIALRFGTFLLACVLLALHWGRALSHEVANLCEFFGLCGLAFYFCLELVADQRARQEQQELNSNFGLADHRLSQRLLAEQKMARILENEHFHQR